MKKIILLVSVIVSLWASPESDMLRDDSTAAREFKEYSFAFMKTQENFNEQTSEALLKQGNINTTQIEINDLTRNQVKAINSDISDIKTKLSYVNTQGTSPVVSSDVKYINQKVNSLEDKLYRLERMLAQQDERLRAVERRIK